MKIYLAGVESFVNEIAGVKIPKNGKRSGFIEAYKEFNKSSVGIHFTVIEGKNDGPVVEVDAAVHGNESIGTHVVVKLIRSIEPEYLNGTLILIPVLNSPAFSVKARINVVDQNDMNRAYPGSDTGSMTQRLAFAHFNEFVLKSDYVISCHCGGGSLRDFILGPPTELGRVATESLSLMKASGFHIVDQQEKLGFLHHTGSLHYVAAKRGIPTVLPEITTESPQQDVRMTYDHIINMLRHIGVLSGSPVKAKKQYIVKRLNQKAACAGLWVPKKKLRDPVKKGDITATIVDPYKGNRLEKLKAPHDGILTQMCQGPILPPGVRATNIGKIIDEI